MDEAATAQDGGFLIFKFCLTLQRIQDSTDIGSMQGIKYRYSAQSPAWKRTLHTSGKYMKNVCVCVGGGVLAANNGTILYCLWGNEVKQSKHTMNALLGPITDLGTSRTQNTAYVDVI
jgi:hypothetical protein